MSFLFFLVASYYLHNGDARGRTDFTSPPEVHWHVAGFRKASPAMYLDKNYKFRPWWDRDRIVSYLRMPRAEKLKMLWPTREAAEEAIRIYQNCNNPEVAI